MIINPPPAKKVDKTEVSKVSKAALTDALCAATKKLVSTDEGTMTVAQVMAERLTNIACFAASNADAVSAAKVIFERLEGKAAVAKVDEAKPMPRVVFSLTEDNMNRIEGLSAEEAIKVSEVEDDGSGIVVVTDKDTGKTWVS